MRIVLISDTHGREDFEVPQGDVLIHAGDMTEIGTVPMVAKAAQWFKRQPHFRKIAIAGNHDWAFEKDKYVPRQLLKEAGVIYLEDEAYELEVDGEKAAVYGSPWQPEFCNWAFNLPRGSQLKAAWDRIPLSTQILITHGPPYHILDLAPKQDQDMRYNMYSDSPFDQFKSLESVGCCDLEQAIQRIKPALHVFGHIHRSYGVSRRVPTLHVNASICGESYRADNAPVVVDYVPGHSAEIVR